MSDGNVIEEILDTADITSKNLQTPILNDEQIDLNHMLRTYQWLKKKLWGIIIGILLLMFAVGKYMTYSQSFKERISKDIVGMHKEIEILSKENKVLNTTCQVNENKVENMKYRIQTILKFKSLELKMSKLEHDTN